MKYTLAAIAVLVAFYLGTQHPTHHYQNIGYGLAVDSSTGTMCAERAAVVKPDVQTCNQ